MLQNITDYCDILWLLWNWCSLQRESSTRSCSWIRAWSRLDLGDSLGTGVVHFRSHKILRWICMNLPHRWKTSRLCALWPFDHSLLLELRRINKHWRRLSVRQAFNMHASFIHSSFDGNLNLNGTLDASNSRIAKLSQAEPLSPWRAREFSACYILRIPETCSTREFHPITFATKWYHEWNRKARCQVPIFPRFWECSVSATSCLIMYVHIL